MRCTGGSYIEPESFEPDPRPTGVRRLARSYRTLLSDGDIERGKHREVVGSPATTWEGAGRFQLHLLREMGLEQGPKPFIFLGAH